MVISPEAQYTNVIANFIQSYWWVFAVIFAVVFITLMFVKFQSKKPKIISRSEVEKSRRLDELKYNNRIIAEDEKVLNYETGKEEIVDTKFNEYRWLKHGGKLLGNIISIGKATLNPDNKEFYEIVFKPCLIGRIPNPSAKQDIMVAFKKDLLFFKNEKIIMIKHDISIDKDMGRFFTKPNEKDVLNLINEGLYKTDKESNASFYFVESQKRSTFDIDFAHDMALKEKELQVELAKKRGKMTSI